MEGKRKSDRNKDAEVFVSWYARKDEAERLVKNLQEDWFFLRRTTNPATNKALPEDHFWLESLEGDKVFIFKTKSSGYIVQSSVGTIPLVIDITPCLRPIKQ